MNVRQRILQNLENRVSPVTLFITLKGVENDGGREELAQMKREGIVENVDAFGNSSRIEGSGLYRLTLAWTNRGIQLD